MLDLHIVNGADPNYTTNSGETVFDDWPDDAEKQSRLAEVLRKHNVTRATRELDAAQEPRIRAFYH